MALRVLLVGLVACLGLELPGADEVSAWNAGARSWVVAWLDDVSKLSDSLPRESTNPPASIRADLAFDAVVEGMTSTFSDDLAENLSVSTLIAPVEATSEPVAIESPGSRAEKLNEAVRLTRQAVDAWASLIRPSEDDRIEGDSF